MPSETTAQLSAWPGMMMTGRVAATPSMVTMAVSDSVTPSALAEAGEIITPLPQVTLVIGSGCSWSQPLLAKRPSNACASAVKITSQPLAPGEGGATALAAVATSAARAVAVTAGDALPGTKPSASAFFQPFSSAPNACEKV